jgi:DeoR family transcriptional regulator of aga operon
VLKEEVLPVPVRRERMLKLITDREFVRVSELAEAFGISDVTVRADLASLQSTHAVRRVRGGVMAPARGTRPEPSFEESLVEFAHEKQRIGEYAASLVHSGMSVFLDVGTTTTAVARALVARHDLERVTVVTNGLNVALELESAMPRLVVVVTGGTLRRLQHSLVNPLATTLLEQLHVDLAVVGCNGIDPDGFTNINLPEAEVKRAVIAGARRTVVVADGSKLGQTHLGRIARLADVDTLVTGPSAPAHEVRRLRKAGLDVVRLE